MNQFNQIQHLLEQLRLRLERYQVVGVRTDYTVSNSTGNSLRCLVPEKHGMAVRYAVLSPREGTRRHGVAALEKYLGIKDRAEANAILDMAHELSEINDLGSWPLAVDARPEIVATSTGIGGRAYRRLPGLEQAFRNMGDAMPSISEIVLTMNTGSRKQTLKSTKTWASFRDRSGDELCALTLGQLALSLKKWFAEGDADRPTADRHLGRWANQVNADQGRFIEAAMELIKFDSILGVTRIQFHGA